MLDRADPPNPRTEARRLLQGSVRVDMHDLKSYLEQIENGMQADSAPCHRTSKLPDCGGKLPSASHVKVRQEPHIDGYYADDDMHIHKSALLAAGCAGCCGGNSKHRG